MSKFTKLNFSFENKFSFLLGGVGALAVAYGIYKLIQRLYEPDDYFTTLKWQGGGAQRRILVLGLEGAGKSRLLQCFQKTAYPDNILPTPAPSIGYNIHSVGMGGVDYHFLEGSCGLEYSAAHLGVTSCIDMVVWVVDSSNPKLFGRARNNMHSFLKTCDDLAMLDSKEFTSLVGLPIVLVASKQDVKGSVPLANVLHEMGIVELQQKHKIYSVGTQLPDAGQRKGLWRLYELVAFAEQKRNIEYSDCEIE